MTFRDGPVGPFRLPVSWTATAAAGAALFVALGLLLVDRSPAGAPGVFAGPRGEFDELMEPVTGVLSAPVRWVAEGGDYVRGYFRAADENRKLKLQVAELERWRDAAIALKSVNDRYEALLKLRTEPPIPSVAARVTLDARGPFSNARLADAGTERGVKVGDPVLSQHGAVGRVVGVTRGASRILLMTDAESRTPVIVDRTNARGILIGDGGSYPRLDYVRGQDPIRPGDVLLTSGDGGAYPRGLPVGVAAKDFQGAWRARLYADRAPIDYVRILSYQDFSAAIDPKSLSPNGAMPPLSDEEQTALRVASAPAKPPAASAAAPKLASPPTVAVPADPEPARKDVQAPAPPVKHPRPAAVSTKSEAPLTESAAPVETTVSPKPKAKAKPATGKPKTPKAAAKSKPAEAAKPKPRPAPVKPPAPLADMDGLH